VPEVPVPRRLGWIGSGLGIILALVWTPAAAERAPSLRPSYQAKLYEVGSARSRVLFDYELSESRDGQHRFTQYADATGTLVAREDLLMEHGELRRYRLDLLTAGRSGRIERAGDRLSFSYTRDGRTDTNIEDYAENVVVGLMLVPYIRSHWTELIEGRELPVRFAVADRLETVGFRLARVEQARLEDAVTIAFKPSSFIIRLLVDPLYFTFTSDGDTVLEIFGRTTPLLREKSRWVPVEVDGVYTKLP
jgi:hypothetical protein